MCYPYLSFLNVHREVENLSSSEPTICRRFLCMSREDPRSCFSWVGIFCLTQVKCGILFNLTSPQLTERASCGVVHDTSSLSPHCHRLPPAKFGFSTLFLFGWDSFVFQNQVIAGETPLSSWFAIILTIVEQTFRFLICVREIII